VPSLGTKAVVLEKALPLALLPVVCMAWKMAPNGLVVTDRSRKPVSETEIMKFKSLTISLVLCASLFLQSCASNLKDDAFAHAVKSGNHTETMRLMQPYHGKLQIQEVNGNWYHPLQYAIANGDKDASFALIQRGSPTQFDGKSLAYNAARVNHGDLARDFAAAGYGSQNDIQQAYADIRAERAATARANKAALAMGCVFLAALMGGGSSNGGSSHICKGCGTDYGNYPGTDGYCQRCTAFMMQPR
jgi:hypothetical protein